MGVFKDLTGMKFGRLFVIGPRERQGPHLSWLCRCDCGREKWVLGYDMRQGKTKSCGCMQGKSETRVKHGHGRRSGRTRTYQIWKNIWSRCYSPNNPGHENYGGRGIRIDERWRDYRNFLADMGECPRGMSIDRINNEGHYEPGNCRWASRTQQANNKRTNLMITYKGETKTLADWCRELDLPYSTIYQRIHSLKRPPEVAFNAQIIMRQIRSNPLDS